MRWMATVTYRTETGELEVDHLVDELSDLEPLIERGPSFEAIQEIRITYEATDRAMTIEATEQE